jgi:uroporphyrinogen-III synthase
MDAVYTVPDWRPLHFPLVRVVGLKIRAARIDSLPSMVAVTSQNALPALKALWGERPDLKSVPHSAVGIATARAMRALGVDPVAVCKTESSDAASLADRVLALTEPGHTVLWPRGDRATELRGRLMESGRVVLDPIAYRTEDIEGSVVPKNLSAVFFASPSAVRVWLRTPNAPRALAIAIGQTTYAEMAPEYASFSRMIQLPRPTPKALAEALAK